MAKKVERVCRYKRCRHGGKINIETDKFVKDNGCYFHEDCYQERADMKLFRNLWSEHISDTVVYSQLNRTLNELLDIESITSDYLLFVLQYVIDNHCKLRYPGGFKYYVDKQEIKDAYKKKRMKKIQKTDFVVKEDETDAPTFSIPKKPNGFSSILGGR